MKKIAVTVIVIATISNVLAGTYNGGAGTEMYPYHIADANDIEELRVTSDDWNLHFIMTADIDLSGTVYPDAVIAPDTNSSSDHFQGIPFTGVFDGNDHTISNLTINSTGSFDYLGFFGKIDGSSAEVKDLGVEDLYITGGYNSDYIGGVCGVNTEGTITNCYSTGNVGGYNTDYIGGVCGYTNGQIVDCYSTSTLDGFGFIGGICGVLGDGGSILDCYSTVSVTGHYYLGGQCGYNSNGSITNSHSVSSLNGRINPYHQGSDYLGGLCGFNNNGSITGCGSFSSVTGHYNLGGLCGRNSGLITKCYSTGSVTGEDNSYRIGGLCGWNWSRMSNCYSTCDVAGGVSSSMLGGLCGKNKIGTITNCYSTGSVTGGDSSNNLGGLVGWSVLTATGSYWDIETSGRETSSGGTGKTTAHMQTQSTFASWDFDPDDGDAADWMMLREGEDYPRLVWQEMFAGDIGGLYGVNFVDFGELARHWNKSGCPPGCEDADINGDGSVNVTDLMYLADDWIAGKDY